MEKIKVSVIMSCYNEKVEWIEQSIKSIINQTYKNMEIIIVNDNPKNKKLIELLKIYLLKDNRIKIINNNENLGLVKSLNKALKNATGEYIARMDADDISHRNRIERQVKYLIENKEISIVSTYANIIDENNVKIGKYDKNPVDFNKIKKILKYRNNFIHPTWMFRKNILDILIEYNEVPYAEDYEFLCRAVTNEYKIATIPELLLDYRMRESSISNSNRLKQQASFQNISSVYKKALNKGIPMQNINYQFNEEIKLDEKNIEKYQNYSRTNSKIVRYGYIILMLINNRYKRRQLVNEINYKIYLFIFKLKNN